MDSKRKLAATIIISITLLLSNSLIKIEAQPCISGLTSTYLSLPANGGSSVDYIYSSCYNFYASSGDSWLNVVTNTYGSYFTASANQNNGNARTGTVTVIDFGQNYGSYIVRYVTVYQPSSCVASTSPTSVSVSPTQICPGSSATLTVNGGSLGTGASWKWYTGGCGSTYIGSGSSITVSPTTQTTYYVRAEGNCGTTSCAAGTVYIKTTVIPSSVNSDATGSVCPGTAVHLSQIGGSLPSGSTWVWYAGSVGGTSIGTGDNINVSPTTSTSYYVRAEGDCGNSSAVSGGVTVISAPDPATSISISPSNTVCPGTNVTFSKNGGSSGVTWKWYDVNLNEVGTGTSLQVTASVATTYFVKAFGGCNLSSNYTSSMLYVKSTSAAPTGISLSDNNQCPGTQITMTVTGGYLGVGGVWKWYTGSCGGTYVGEGPNINVSPTVSTTYYVRAEGECGNPTSCASTTVSVKTTSTAPTGTSLNNDNQCPGIPITMTVTGGNLGTGAVWRWYSGSCGGTSVGQGSSIDVTPSVTTTYYVRAEGCNTTTCVSATVTVKTLSSAPSSINLSDNNKCPGTLIHLSVVGGSLGTGASWKWYSGSCGGESVGQGSSIDVTPSITTTYYVRAEGCNITTCASNTLTVLPSTSITNQPANSTVEPSQNGSFSITSTGPNIQYQWQTSSTTYGSWNNITGSTSSNLSISPVSPLVTKFYRCQITSTCQILSSNSASLSYKPKPEVVSQTSSSNSKAVGSSFSMRAYSSNGVDWTDLNVWDFSGTGSVSWDEDKQAWRIVGYKLMYLKPSYAIPVDVNRSYTIAVEVFRENSESKYIYWGGKRLASDRSTVLAGYGGSYDFSATSGSVYPTVGQWVTYKINSKSGTSNGYSGWNNDNCAFYAVGGLINSNGSNTQVTYVRNIEFYETGQAYSYQWKKNTTNISEATNPTFTLSSVSNQDEGSYTCLISNTFSSVTSDPILLDVKEPFVSPDLSNENYIYVQEPNKEAKSVNEFTSLCYDEVKHSVQYFDGLGRLIQTDIIGGSPQGKDIITPNYYDSFGRESIKYLPYTPLGSNNGSFIDTAISNQYHFYQGANYYPGDTANAKTVYEDSPLNRVREQGAPGRPWQPYDASDSQSGHTIKFDYLSNSQHEVLFWKISGDTLVNTDGDSYKSFNYYPENTLFKTINKDENWKQTDSQLRTKEEFKDLQGNIVLKRSFVENGASIDTLDTYYVYDDFNLLRYVLSPKAIAAITSSMDNLLPNDDVIKGLCYYYKYDNRNRMITKQLPGVDPVYIIFDKRDRVVLTQDGNLRKDANENPLKKWLFTKYDRLNRPVLTGKLTYGSDQTQAQMQTIVDSTIYSEANPRDYYIDRNTALTTTLGFTDESFPKSTDGSLEYLTATYYDSYDFPDSLSFDNASSISDYWDSEGNTHYFDNLYGIITGTKAEILGTSTYITTTNYYDDKYRALQSLKNLYEDNNGIDIISNKYDFIGNVTQSRQKQKFDGASIYIDKFYTLDHENRMTKIESKINGGSPTTIAEMQYNELGQLLKKELNKSGSSSLQELNYRYNMRGWLSRINNPDTLGTDLFSMKLLYDDPSTLTNLSKEPQFNGNISGMIWNRNTSTSATLKSAYTFTYDALNRISNNYYGEGSSLANSNKNREYDYSYDQNGNILALKRNNGSSTMIDNLSYGYLNALSNQLITVTDNSSNTAGLNDRNISGRDYFYDKNGNLTKDLNKEITSISYNFLNLPSVLTKDANNSITYYYDAMGTKLKQVVVSSGNPTSRYYYDGFEYLSNKTLSLIHMDEGVINSDSTGTFAYEYFVKDHLGNTRVSFENSSGTALITQSVDYYPFGLQFVPVNQGGTNKYLYNGKELQDESLGGVNLDWYDYGARFYDPQIGRWTSIDPLAEIYRKWSPYNYGVNNPMRFMDADGMYVYETNNAYVYTGQDAQDLFRELQSQSSSNNQDQQDDKKKKEDKQDPNNHPLLKSAVQTSLDIGNAINFYSDLLGGPEGSSIDKLVFWTKMYLYGKIFSLFGEAATSISSATKVETTVLGSYEEGGAGNYIGLAKKLKANYFEVPPDIWNKMSIPEREALNYKFLDVVVARGDNIVLSHSAYEAKSGTSFYKELQYLYTKGFKPSADGMHLIKP